MEKEEVIDAPVQENQEEEVETIEPIVEEKRETLKLPGQVEIDGVKYPKELVEKAKQEGWREKSFLDKIGKGDKYVDPKTFDERGEKVLPFLNKKLTKIEKENSTLKDMLKKQLSNSVKDRMESVEKQIKDAKEYGEYDSVEKLIEKKIELKGELNDYSKEEVVEQPQILTKPQEINEWEVKNNWCLPIINGMQNPNYSPERQRQATAIFQEISNSKPYSSLSNVLQEVDNTLIELDNKSRQKANVTPPIQGASTSAITPTNRKSFENLSYTSRKIFDEACVGVDGKPFTGEVMKVAKASFLERCGDESFKK